MSFPYIRTPSYSPTGLASDTDNASRRHTLRSNAVDPHQASGPSSLSTGNERNSTEFYASGRTVAVMGREQGAGPAQMGGGQESAAEAENASLLRKIKEISDRARSMQMERDGWRAESERLARVTAEGQGNDLVEECQRLQAENTAIRSKADVISMHHARSVEEWIASVTESADTMKQLQGEMTGLAGNLGPEKRMDGSAAAEKEREFLHQRFAASESALQKSREELARTSSAYEAARTTISKLFTEVQRRTTETSDSEDLQAARATVCDLTDQLGDSNGRIQGFEAKLVAERTAREEADSWQNDCQHIKRFLHKKLR